MKKITIALVLLLTAGIVSSYAQGGFRRTVEEKVKTVHDKMDSAFKLNPDILTRVDSIFTTYYKATDKVREEIFAGGGGQGAFQQMQEKNKPHIEERDAKLKPLIGDENFKIWKEQIEPTLRPGRPGGGRGNN